MRKDGSGSAKGLSVFIAKAPDQSESKTGGWMRRHASRPVFATEWARGPYERKDLREQIRLSAEGPGVFAPERHG